MMSEMSLTTLPHKVRVTRKISSPTPHSLGASIMQAIAIAFNLHFYLHFLFTCQLTDDKIIAGRIGSKE